MKKADNFDASKWLVENKITFQSRLNENKVNNLYMVYDKELSDKDKDVYGFSKQMAFYYLKKFNNDKVNARQFLKDDKVWNNFIKNLNNVEQMSDKELEDAMRSEMSMYFFNKPDKLGESQLNEIEKFDYDVDIKWKSQPANPKSILTDTENGEEFTKEEFWKSDIIGYDPSETLPDYGNKNPDGTWTFDFVEFQISGFIEGEDFTFDDEETNNLNEGSDTYPFQADSETIALYDRIANELEGTISMVASKLEIPKSDIRISLDYLYDDLEDNKSKKKGMFIQVKADDAKWDKAWTGNPLIMQTTNDEGVVIPSNPFFGVSIKGNKNPKVRAIYNKALDLDLETLAASENAKIADLVSPEEMKLIAPNTPIVVTGK